MSSTTIATRNNSFLMEKTGSIQTRQKLVIQTMQTEFQNGVTAKQLAAHLHLEGKVATPERNQVHPRLNELVKAGLVEVSGKVKDNSTGRKVAWYVLTDDGMTAFSNVA